MALFKKRKRPQVVGLDIGSSFVKAVELRIAGGDFELAGFGMASLPPGAVEGGEIKQPAAVQAAIRQALEQGRIQATEAIIGMSGGAVIAKRVTLPKMSEAELSESIRWEAEQHIPFDIEDVELDFQVLRQDGPQLEVMLVAVKKGKVQSYVDVVGEAGLSVLLADFDVFALETQYEFNFQGEKDVVALVNIGHETTNTNILQGGQNVYARDIFVGGKQYSTTIAQHST
jgi:type IV pilus assembly protein PilM